MSAVRARAPRRVGVFGGTFDPPHVGHLALAECARDALGLARVLFVPAADPPHKRRRAMSSIAHRLAMTRLAVKGFPAFEVTDLEAGRPGPSYTVETLHELRRRRPRVEWWLLIGEDSLRDLPAWRAPDEIAALARLAVAPRADGRGPAHVAGRGVRASGTPWRVHWLPAAVLDVSSSALRERARRGASLRVLVPDAVAAYVRRHRLYRRSG